MKSKSVSLLEGVCILDLADEPGSFCSKLLADMGAAVIKIESAEGDPTRRLRPFNPARADLSRTSLSFFYHNTNKLGIALNLDSPKGKHALHRLIEGADVLVETFAQGRLEALDLGASRLRVVNPHLIHISITGFGRSGPKRSFLFSDSVASAFGGQMYLSRAPSEPPVKLFGLQSFYTASLFGANAVLLALRKRKVTGKGSYIDLSIQESVASTLDHVMIDYFHEGKITGRQDDSPEGRYFAMLPCKDGFIQITAFRNWETLTQLLDSEGKAGDLSDKKWQREAYRKRHFKHIIDVLSEWTRDYTKLELFELGQAMQFPWAPVFTLQEVLHSPQLKTRRFFVRTVLPVDNSIMYVPGFPCRFSGLFSHPLKPPPLLGEHNSQFLKNLCIRRGRNTAGSEDRIRSGHSMKSGSILRGIRVVDLTRMLSGPYATRILGDFGAEVIKVQSELTSQGAERNDLPYFSAWNRNKRSICLNLDHPGARDLFLDLTAVSDIVVENYSPRVLANWSLTYKHLKRVRPDLIMASISAMGHTGPWKDFVGFGPTFHALSGLISATSTLHDTPINLGHAYGDVIAGLYAALAILTSLEHRDRTGKGQYLDLSAYEALCTLLGPALMEADLAGRRKKSGKQSAESGGAVPCGCYPCAGEDRWCVIVVINEEQWRAFCRATGKAELTAEKFSTSTKRERNRAELDRLIAGWTSSLVAETVVRRLQKAGIAAGIVQDAADLARDKQLAARHFFVSLKHPILGATYSDRSALWPWREKPMYWKAAPRLGEDNRYVFVQLLGHSESDLKSFAKKGIIQ
jgi:crotonobetainyl-CoA:carnitine CoA-transferase CaiB-like acyl-CoA transferase